MTLPSAPCTTPVPGFLPPRARELFDALGEALFVHDPDTGQVLDANRAAGELYGYPPDAMRGFPLTQFDWGEPPYSVDTALDWLRRAWEQGPQCFEWRARDARGGDFWIEVALRPAKILGRSVVLASVRNIDRRKALEQERMEAERRLRRSEVLDVVGQLAGGVAHQFNNILGSVLGSVYQTRQETAATGAAAALEHIEALCRRGSDLTRQLLAVARRQDSDTRGVVDLGEVVRPVAALLEQTLGKGVEVDLRLPEDPVRVEADRSQLTTVVLNLALNARDAMGGAGRLELRVEREHDVAGNRAVLRVSDTGCGVPEALRERIFEPFFTTKDVGRGTGLGLATATATVERWGGSLTLADRPGPGSCFVVRLPEALPAPLEGEGPATDVHPVVGGKVLLVADDPELVDKMTGCLIGAGYGVEHADDGLDALERLHGRGEEMGLVILDPALPRFGAAQVHRILTGLVPELPVLLLAGGPGQPEVGGNAACLPQPFDDATLLRAVAEAAGMPAAQLTAARDCP